MSADLPTATILPPSTAIAASRMTRRLGVHGDQPGDVGDDEINGLHVLLMASDFVPDGQTVMAGLVPAIPIIGVVPS